MSKDAISDILIAIGAIVALYWAWVVLQMLIHIPRVGGAAPGQRKRLLLGGIILFSIGFLSQAASNTPHVVQGIGRDSALTVSYLSFLFVLGGAGVIAMAKGRHAAWGLLGLLSCIGFTLILCLKDHDIPSRNTSSSDNLNIEN